MKQSNNNRQNITFRSLEGRDIPWVTELYNWYILHSTTTFHEESLSEQQMTDTLLSQGGRYGAWVVECDGAQCGYCKLTKYRERPAYDITVEVTVYLKQEWIGRSLGRRAMVFLEEQACRNKFHSIMAVISAENLASINLFKKCGFLECAMFKEVGRKFDRLLDVVVYQKIINCSCSD